MGRSVLDCLGEEVTGIVAPVSICMAVTVALVRILNPDGASDSNAVFLTSAYYEEQAGDSTGEKLGGSLINALIFVGVVAVMTFILVLLFKYGCVRVIYAYMGLAGFSIFFVLTGIIAIQLLQKWDVHIDYLSFAYILFNFAMVGSLTLFFFPAPLLMKQCYLIITGVVTAYIFTWVPEWTTWMLLGAMALYDVLAVLVPGGPLKMLVELAQEREETIPALVYEARPVRRDNNMQPRQAAADEGAAAAAMPPLGQHMAAVGPLQQELPVRMRAPPQQQKQQPQQEEQQHWTPGGIAVLSIQSDSAASSARGAGSSAAEPSDTPDTPLVASPRDMPPPASSSGRPRSAPGRGTSSSEAEPRGAAVQPSGRSAPAAVEQMHAGAGQQQQHDAPVAGRPQDEYEEDDDDMFSLPDSIKLGLGDFIFYSMLVGRAAMYDYLTVFACYLAIIAGLGCTLLWLAMARKALPALPISITLAVCFYFISRFVMEPVILPMTLQLVYF